MPSLIGQLRLLIKELKTVDTDKTEDMIIDTILASLPDTYSTLIMEWELLEREKKTVSELILRISIEEKKKKLELYPETNGRKVKIVKCFKCNKPGHEIKDCIVKKLFCTHCHSRAHNKRNCGILKQKRFNPTFKGSAPNQK